MDTVENIEKEFDEMFEKALNDFSQNYIDYNIQDGKKALMYYMAWSTFAQMANTYEER